MKRIVEFILILTLLSLSGFAFAESTWGINAPPGAPYGPPGTIWENWNGSPHTVRGVQVYSTNAKPYAITVAVDPSKKKALGSNVYRYQGFVVAGTVSGTVSALVKVVVNCNSGRYKILMPQSGGIDSRGYDRPSRTHDFGWESAFRIHKGEGLCN